MPVSISGTTGYAGPLGAITVDTGSIQANAVTPAKMSRTGTAGQVLTSNGAGADPSYQALPAGGVTSAVAGNGVAVSAATGAVTFSAAAPGFNTVGSYVFGFIGAGGSGVVSSGSNYSAGAGDFQVRSYSGSNGVTNNLSGTWKWMGGTANFTGCGGGTSGIFVRVS